ncbi:MAG: ABC transporter permease subunit [Sporichthyaceae bacterium]
MNTTIAMLTARTLFGRRRALLLLVLPGVLLALSIVLRLAVQESSRADVTVGLLGTFAIATVVPLLSLIAGTGALGGEIDDGSIVYLLSKPISRHAIVVTKLLVAVAVTTVFGALPVLVSGWILVGGRDGLALAYGLGAFAGGAAYCALFLLLSVLNRNAVVIGLIYTLVWETAIGGLVLGAQGISIQQWALAVTRAVVGGDAERLGITAAVRPQISVVMLLVVVVGGTWLAGYRLRSIRLTSAE